MTIPIYAQRDATKRNTLLLTLASPRAEAKVLAEYLWTKEAAESVALEQITEGAPPQQIKLTPRPLRDELRSGQ